MDVVRISTAEVSISVAILSRVKKKNLMRLDNSAATSLDILPPLGLFLSFARFRKLLQWIVKMARSRLVLVVASCLEILAGCLKFSLHWSGSQET